MKVEPSTQGGFNLGGTNGTGQVPVLPGNFGLVDLDTPKEAWKFPSYSDGSDWQLIFSDEFNKDGRTFYPGDDPYWEVRPGYYRNRRNIYVSLSRPLTCITGQPVMKSGMILDRSPRRMVLCALRFRESKTQAQTSIMVSTRYKVLSASTYLICPRSQLHRWHDEYLEQVLFHRRHNSGERKVTWTK